jgi:hypothetical protein
VSVAVAIMDIDNTLRGKMSLRLAVYCWILLISQLKRLKIGITPTSNVIENCIAVFEMLFSGIIVP